MTDATQATQDSPLYEKLGGEPAVNAAVDVFYRKVIADPRINTFFGVDMAKQAARQKAFLTMAFGGPHTYTGLDMRRGHARLVEMGLTDRHFDAVLEHFGNNLRELGIAEPLVTQVNDIAESTRTDVLGR
jgi:hemoglobin